ncbi:hypothetical protein [Bacillus cereus]|uniref:Uncharacterized protein n=1 Tax=Bacillus cereus (strain VD014) TaxID=1053223 RepID=A0A9W5K4Y2_BACC8|nr:hypothetical protein [Bacillus cereus]EJR18258.1 hypothetical protein IIA_04211 [Bacillus cereus VD014]MBJ8150539.1 hypothetical protein [Bacillus cereus]
MSVKDNRIFSWMDTVRYIEQTKTLNDVQKGSLIIMSTFLEFDGQGRLITPDGEYLTANKLVKILGKSRKTVNRILDNCEYAGLLFTEAIGKDRNITFTPSVFGCGHLEIQPESSYVKVFKIKVRKLVKELSLKDLGFLADLLPHFHKDSYILCENPTWNGFEGMRAYTESGLQKLFGLDKRTLNGKIKKLRACGFLMITLGRSEVYYVSPEFVSRKNKKETLEYIQKVATEYSDNFKDENLLK